MKIQLLAMLRPGDRFELSLMDFNSLMCAIPYQWKKEAKLGVVMPPPFVDSLNIGKSISRPIYNRLIERKAPAGNKIAAWSRELHMDLTEQGL